MALRLALARFSPGYQSGCSTRPILANHITVKASKGPLGPQYRLAQARNAQTERISRTLHLVAGVARRSSLACLCSGFRRRCRCGLPNAISNKLDLYFFFLDVLYSILIHGYISYICTRCKFRWCGGTPAPWYGSHHGRQRLRHQHTAYITKHTSWKEFLRPCKRHHTTHSMHHTPHITLLIKAYIQRHIARGMYLSVLHPCAKNAPIADGTYSVKVLMVCSLCVLYSGTNHMGPRT